MNLDAELAQQRFRRLRQARRQRGQHAVSRLDDAHLDVLVGVDAVEPERDDFARRAVQLGGQLDAGGAGADDRDLELLGPQRRRLRMGADAGVDHARVEAPRIGQRLELHRMLADAGRAEVVALAAHGDDERVVAEGALRRDLATLVVERRRDVHLAPCAVEPDHLADPVAEAVPVRLREVIDLVRREVHAAGRDLVQFGFPDMRSIAVDQRDVGAALAAEPIAELRCELEPARAAAADDHAVSRSTIGFHRHL